MRIIRNNPGPQETNHLIGETSHLSVIRATTEDTTEESVGYQPVQRRTDRKEKVIKESLQEEGTPELNFEGQIEISQEAYYRGGSC